MRNLGNSPVAIAAHEVWYSVSLVAGSQRDLCTRGCTSTRLLASLINITTYLLNYSLFVFFNFNLIFRSALHTSCFQLCR
jgi:hypothetical protein